MTSIKNYGIIMTDISSVVEDTEITWRGYADCWL